MSVHALRTLNRKPPRGGVFRSRSVSRILREIRVIWLNYAGFASPALPMNAVEDRPRDAPVMHGPRGPSRHARPIAGDARGRCGTRWRRSGCRRRPSRGRGRRIPRARRLSRRRAASTTSPESDGRPRRRTAPRARPVPHRRDSNACTCSRCRTGTARSSRSTRHPCRATVIAAPDGPLSREALILSPRRSTHRSYATAGVAAATSARTSRRPGSIFPRSFPSS
jgi:hypothetical protein